MWVFPIFGKRHGLLFFRAPDLAYSEEQGGSIGFISVLPPWKKCWVYHLAPHFCAGPWQESQLQRDSLPSSLSLYSYGDSQERGSQINVKVQILHPFIQASLQSLLSAGKVIPRIEHSPNKGSVYRASAGGHCGHRCN